MLLYLPQSQAFRFVHQVITGSGFTQEEKENVQIEVFNHLKVTLLSGAITRT